MRSPDLRLTFARLGVSRRNRLRSRESAIVSAVASAGIVEHRRRGEHVLKNRSRDATGLVDRPDVFGEERPP